MKVPTFKEFMNEEDRPAEVKDKKTGETKIDKSQIPKDQQLKALAKELYNSVIDAFQTQFKLKDSIQELKDKGEADDDDIAEAEADGAIQMAEIQMRADAIEQQMIAVGTDPKNPNLVIMAQQLASEARNLAGKENQKYFKDRAERKHKEREEKKKDKPKEEEKKK